MVSLIENVDFGQNFKMTMVSLNGIIKNESFELVKVIVCSFKECRRCNEDAGRLLQAIEI